MINLLVILLATIASSILYRAGGMSKEATANPKWMPMWMRKSWVRDWLIPMVCILAIWLTCHIKINLWWLLFYGLTGGALTTYWDSVFGFDNFWFAGFMVGIATFPLIFCGLHWYMVLARALVLAVLWGGWCAIFSKDTVEEYGRGAFITATIPLLLI